MATCNKCQQYRGLKSKRGRQIDEQIEIVLVDKNTFLCFFFFLFCPAGLAPRFPPLVHSRTSLSISEAL